MRHSFCALWVLTVLGIGCALNAAGAEPPPLRVMSFNIRFGTAADGDNHWDRRKEFLVETIQAFAPDLLGTQETLGFQRDYLAQQLPGYDSLGVGREDGGDKGEMMAVFYRRERFEKVEAGHFWLSKTPDVVGSKSWDSSLPRMATWVKLRDHKQPSASPFLFLNTHFDHRGVVARAESARLMRRQIESLGRGGAAIVTGDFNAGEGSEPYRLLFGEFDDRPSPVRDSLRLAHSERQPQEGTATGFKAKSTGGARIDWIAVSPHWEVKSAAIDRTQREGRTPSDHFPVTAVLTRRVVGR